VALLLPDLSGGGAERVFTLLAREFSARGIEVDLLLGRAAGAYVGEVPSGVRVIPLQAPSARGGSLDLAWSMIAGVRRYLQAGKPTVLMSTLTGTNLVAALAGARLKSSTRLVLREANTSANRRSRLLTLAARQLYRRADALVAISTGVAEDLVADLGIDAGKVHVIHNPIDAARVRQLAAAPCPHPWLASRRVPVVLGIGRLMPQKGFDLLLRALHKVRQERLVRVLILGDGEERVRLQAMIEQLGLTDAAVLAGFQCNPFPWLARSAVFALPSRWEGFGQVLIEALALGRPVVASDCRSGPSEILDRGRFGALVPCEDSDALAAALLVALRAPPDANLLRARAESFSLSRQANSYLEVLFAGRSGASNVE
jgi:glycosyltransferase involved in cell wall biosynthesis